MTNLHRLPGTFNNILRTCVLAAFFLVYWLLGTRVKIMQRPRPTYGEQGDFKDAWSMRSPRFFQDLSIIDAIQHVCSFGQ